MTVKRSCFLLLSILMVFMFENGIKANAVNTGFSTEELTANEYSSFTANINLMLIKTEPAKTGIQCFDVNENGMIAIGQTGQHGKQVCIYSSDGIFLYGYTFICTQSFGVEWDGEFINIYFVRSDVIVSVDSDGIIHAVKKVQDTINNNSYGNYLLYSTSRNVNGTKYIIRNDMGAFNCIALSYSQLIIANSSGEECIIYDVNSAQFINIIVAFSIIILFIVLAVTIIIRQFFKLRRGT